ncbi:Peptidoglycan-associated lipoprotein [Sphingomonas sp. S2M10]|uniref:OmpA family protein n=1 Tax=Sphingomonas sp. S2M10 TaxID=2705010 RepID=UPI00145729D3|nr:OmpA family protein [Sphingomonas sp. S2M10]NLS26579.1 Peptidoglycan-associated lipoprotein [Sphingomonas sp. S2M10]
MSRWAMLALMGLLAGCEARAPARDNAATANRSILAEEDGLANNSAAEAPKSILRPEVVPDEPEKPELKPVDLVVPFGTSGLKLDDAGRALLDEVLANPTTAAGGTITISGHTDTRGNDRDNLIASRKRAEAVRDYLLSKGVAADRMTVVALGETRALVPNAKADGSDDPEGRAKNRRVEVQVALPQTVPAETAPAAPQNGTAETPEASQLSGRKSGTLR